MSRDSGWEATRAAASAHLRPGESLIALVPAVPPSDSKRGMAPAWLWPLILTAEHLHWRHRVRQASQASAFPLASRMLIGLTAQRLVIWKARGHWRLGDLLGDVPRERIVRAEAPTVGSGWRTVRIHLADGPAVPVRVSHKIADRLADVLSGQQGENAGSRTPA